MKYTKVSETSTCRLRAVLSQPATSDLRPLEAAVVDPSSTRAIKGVLHNSPLLAGEGPGVRFVEPHKPGVRSLSEHLTSDIRHVTSGFSDARGFSLTELMIVLVIIGVLVLLALPKLTPVVTKAKTTEAKLQLKQLYTLEQTYKFEQDRYAASLADIGFEQTKLVSDGGQARYNVEVISADDRSFIAQATAVVDFDNDGTFNVWTVDETGVVKEKTPD